MSISEQLSESLNNGFIDCNLTSLQRYNPRLLINDYKKGMKVLTDVENELRKCEEFYFSVAFITNSGVTSLLNILDELNRRNIKGKIVTSQYQNFTQPVALKRLLRFENIQLRIVTEGNFHAKGYIFKNSDAYSFIIGSSNLTQNALSLNKEWNVKLSSLENGALMQNILNEFDRTFENAAVVDDKWIEQYSLIYNSVKRLQYKGKDDNQGDFDNLLELNKINPNNMQKEALCALEILRNDNKRKALLISATGTGKTYLSAFDVAKFQPKKFLFIVHRENIARAAMRSYKNILGQNINAGLLTGRNANFEKDYTFATIQTISKEENMKRFSSDYFDYIVIDEVHRAGASSYQKILDYFNPKFLLGMSATPERTDGYDIFKAFDYNIAYEIRLSKAMEENMLSPFHYFGVSEISVNGSLLDEKSDFNKLVCEERIERIIEAIDFYGWDSGRIKGLIFCSRKDESKILSKEFNNRGYKTIALDGDSSEDLREEAIARLEQDQLENRLDYIFTVDIFNEGVDIPAVNQVVMLRPTQSAIVFVQQLGRGLRKSKDKEFLTVIDFIGNYSNNYLVPIALYGDRSFNKDSIRKMMNSGSSIIPGCSTINFDEITKSKIFEAIDAASMSRLSDLRKDYELLKYQIGRIPTMTDFLEHGRREPYAFINYSGSYYNFLAKVEKNFDYGLKEQDAKLLEFYSKEILNVKRIDEAVLLSLLIAKEKAPLEELNSILQYNFGYIISDNTVKSVVRNLNGDFLKDADCKKYGIGPSVDTTAEKQDLYFRISNKYLNLMRSEVFGFYINDMIKYALNKFNECYNFAKLRGGFRLYEKYGRKDVCRILNWEKNEESTMYGYRIKYNSCPIFVTYHKNDDISGSTKYEDSFINPSCFNWMTRNRVTLQSEEAKKLQAYKQSGMRILLFIKKSDGEGTDFYYMGDVEPIEFKESTIKNDKGEVLPIVNIKFNMIDEVEESIYRYLES